MEADVKRLSGVTRVPSTSETSMRIRDMTATNGPLFLELIDDVAYDGRDGFVNIDGHCALVSRRLLQRLKLDEGFIKRPSRSLRCLARRHNGSDAASGLPV